MLRGVWQVLNCLSIHATYCVIITGASPVETKMWAAVRENDDFLAIPVRITGKLLKIDGYMLREFGKHWIIFSFMQRFAWLPQGRPQGKQKCGKNRDFWTYALTQASCNSETIEDRYVQNHIVYLWWTSCLRILTKSPAIPQQLYKPASRGLSVIAELLVKTIYGVRLSSSYSAGSFHFGLVFHRDQRLRSKLYSVYSIFQS